VVESVTRSKDVKLQKMQQFALRSVVSMLHVIDILVNSREKKEEIDVDRLDTDLIDLVAMVAVTNTDINMFRRDARKYHTVIL